MAFLMIRPFVWMIALLATVFVLFIAGLMTVAFGQTPPVRAVTTGTLDTATSKDYRGTIIWRSPTAGAKTQRLPACGSFNTGFWVQIVDGQATAGADPITITATTGSVTGPTVPVAIGLNRGAFVLTCDGGTATWRVTAIAGEPGGTGPPPTGNAILIDTANRLLIDTGNAMLIQ
jgi:hypothetical protein